MPSWRSSTYGTSPRVWGEVYPVVPEEIRRRYIPTRVGRGPRRNACPRAGTVHPHACGEREDGRVFRYCYFGTSPRVWGEGQRRWCLRPEGRYIPTRVGRGTSATWHPLPPPVHPHACGERSSSLLAPMGPFGTSPRVWGEALGRARQGEGVRYIPTRVGRGVRCGIRCPPLPQHLVACRKWSTAFRQCDPLLRSRPATAGRSGPLAQGTQAARGNAQDASVCGGVAKEPHQRPSTSDTIVLPQGDRVLPARSAVARARPPHCLHALRSYPDARHVVEPPRQDAACSWSHFSATKNRPHSRTMRLFVSP